MKKKRAHRRLGPIWTHAKSRTKKKTKKSAREISTPKSPVAVCVCTKKKRQGPRDPRAAFERNRNKMEGNDAPRLLHFVRASADEAQFSREAPDATHACLGEVLVGGRASAAPAPDVDRIVLWSSPDLVGSRDESCLTVDSVVRDRGATTGVLANANAHHRPLFKSAIQKCTRRLMPDAAMRFARALADAGGVNDLLRRAVVILIEDAIASPRLPVLVWLMAAAAKGFVLANADIDLVAECMGQAAALAVRDCVPPVESHPDHCARLGAPGNHGIVDALLLRVCYGGTPGDMSMIARAASLWQARLAGPTSALWTESLADLFGLIPFNGDSNTAKASIDLSDRPADSKSAAAEEMMAVAPVRDKAPLVATVPIEAADFHCFPRMCADVARAAAGVFTPEAVREAMWHHRSSINLKRPWTDPCQPLAPPLGRGATNVFDDRIDMDAVVRTARCWTAVSGHVDRIARQAIERVASTIVVAQQESSVDTRAGQKRDRAAAQIDRRPTGRRPREDTRQRSIRSFFGAPRP
ncbi:hypothetical protein psal_cds_347 [Pandoravirus salinus]|uniref:Uncharacterized protein n=1 Tax=Pandoravirus salinus TaxID=1349410 RepID=S4W1K4_9VIRU|nr:hypothetical protein psal_cds_347 [Pandoravirus salinus]AGO83990.1 hypothetical protein psal_cds_347 [Pandoravirus salinus]